MIEIIGEEVFDEVIPTKNNYGICFLKPYASLARYLSTIKPGMNLLDIGSGYGATCTLPALEKGIQVHAIDIEPKHLRILKKLCASQGYEVTVTEGHFPDVEIKENSFDAVVASSSLHYLNAEELDAALIKIKAILKKNGTFFMMTTTPYMKIFKNFLPEYLENKKKNIKPTGLIKDSTMFIAHPVFKSPKKFTLFDKDDLEELLTRAGFNILECAYSSMSEASHYLGDNEVKGGIVYSICSA